MPGKDPHRKRVKMPVPRVQMRIDEFWDHDPQPIILDIPVPGDVIYWRDVKGRKMLTQVDHVGDHGVGMRVLHCTGTPLAHGYVLLDRTFLKDNAVYRLLWDCEEIRWKLRTDLFDAAERKKRRIRNRKHDATIARRRER